MNNGKNKCPGDTQGHPGTVVSPGFSLPKGGKPGTLVRFGPDLPRPLDWNCLYAATEGHLGNAYERPKTVPAKTVEVNDDYL